MPGERAVQRRGPALSQHILMTARALFLDVGYERVSMDAVAAAAGVSKRSVYGHYADKETLFIAVLGLMRDLFLDNLGEPRDFGDDATETVALYVSRLQQILVWEQQVQAFRLGIAEVTRRPDEAAAYFEAVFSTARERLESFLEETGLDPGERRHALAWDVVSRIVLPRLMRVLCGAEPPLHGPEPPSVETLSVDVDLSAARHAVMTSWTAIA